MTREQAAQVTALLQARYPDANITVTRIPGGLHIEVHAGDSSLFAVIGSEDSPLLAALRAFPGPAR
jgi:hypothetical protein